MVTVQARKVGGPSPKRPSIREVLAPWITITYYYGVPRTGHNLEALDGARDNRYLSDAEQADGNDTCDAL